MSILFILPNDKLVLSAFAVVGSAPGAANLAAHRDLIKTAGVDAYVKTLSQILDNSGITNAQLADLVIANYGLSSVTELSSTFLADFFAANAGNRAAAVLQVADLVSNYNADPKYKSVRDNFNNNLKASFDYSSVATNTAEKSLAVLTAVGTEFNLTVAADMLAGTALNDTFYAYVQGNTDSLQSGDVLKGGEGADTLFAQLGSWSNFSITARTESIETVKVQAQAVASDNANGNNVAGNNSAKLDAQYMTGVTNWENTNSRSDLIVEDVRILDSQITKDITITMRETDPGHVDYGVYFDQNSLRTVTNSSSQINLQVMDTLSVVNGTAPLLNSPYGGFRFTATDANGVATVVTLQSQAIDDAQTYAELVTAFQAAADATLGAGNVTVTIGSNFTVTDTTTAQSVTGQEVILKANGAYTFTTPAGSGWIANGVVPANSGLHTNFNQQATSNTDLVTSKVVLDDVGRGSTGGDLVIGGLSVGDTSSSKGVERFEITVEDNSKLQTINSTNNTLREVSIVNGNTTRVDNAYNENQKNAGSLTVNGTVSAVAGSNTQLPGSTAQHNTYGFSDVRLIDGSAMTGKLEFTAEVTSAALAKYVNLTDTAAPTADTVAVAYSGGINNDTMKVDLDSGVTGSNSKINAGREDFTFNFNGGAGNDTIDIAVDRGADSLITAGENALLGNTEFWYTNQVLNKNITIDAGAGDDVIRKPGAGNVVINAGDGNDTVYADNSGAMGAAGVVIAAGALAADGITTINATDAPRAVWVMNTSNQADVGGGYVLAVDDARNLANLESGTNASYNLYKGTVTVQYKGATGLTSSTVTIESTNYKTSDLQINQAIKKAINSDAVLSKLLVAEDGPANSLVVKSLIDGVFINTDLDVVVAAPTAALTATELAGVNASWGSAHANSAAAIGAMVVNQATAAGDKYYAQLAESGVAGNVADTELAGAASLTTSDNTITGGAGNDVIVLGTTVGGTALASSNDTVVFGAGFGSDTVVNFDFAGNGVDKLDFAGTWAATTDDTGALVAVLTSGNGSIVTFTGLDAAITGAQTYAGLDTLTLANFNEAFNAGVGGGLATTAESYLVLVQNDAANAEQYKVFQLTSNASTVDFTAATYMGEVEIVGGTPVALAGAGIIV